jgi:hypothetical protein
VIPRATTKLVLGSLEDLAIIWDLEGFAQPSHGGAQTTTFSRSAHRSRPSDGCRRGSERKSGSLASQQGHRDSWICAERAAMIMLCWEKPWPGWLQAGADLPLGKAMFNRRFDMSWICKY